MVYVDEDIQVQPIMTYTSEDYLSRNRNVYQQSVQRPIVLVDRKKILPITFVKESALTASLTSFLAVNRRTGVQKEILSDLSLDNTYLDSSASKAYIRYWAVDELANYLSYDVFYFIVTDGTNTWWTEDVKACDLSTADYIEIEYYNSFDIGDAVYQYLDKDGNQFKNKINLKTHIENNDYEIFETIFKDENQSEFKADDVRKPIYYFKVLGKNWLEKLFQFISQHDSVYITNNAGQKKLVERIRNITIEEDYGEFKSYKVEFTLAVGNLRVTAGENSNKALTTESRYLRAETGLGLKSETGEYLKP